MTDSPKDAPAETPIQRALRMKKAALQARPGGPADKVRPDQKAMAAGASRPWMKR